MAIAAVRYGIENSAINDIANGIPWSASLRVAGPLNRFLFEAIRVLWLLVPVAVGILMLRPAAGQSWLDRKRFLVFAVPIAILMLFFIFRALGRIDPGSLSRPGIVSIWAMALLLPIVLYLGLGRSRLPAILTGCAFLAGLLAPGLGVNFTAGRVLATPLSVNEIGAMPLNGAEVGMPNLGIAFIDPAHVLIRYEDAGNEVFYDHFTKDGHRAFAEAYLTDIGDRISASAKSSGPLFAAFT